jgi:hypothetical protein
MLSVRNIVVILNSVFSPDIKTIIVSSKEKFIADMKLDITLCRWIFPDVSSSG